MLSELCPWLPANISICGYVYIYMPGTRGHEHEKLSRVESLTEQKVIAISCLARRKQYFIKAAIASYIRVASPVPIRVSAGL